MAGLTHRRVLSEPRRIVPKRFLNINTSKLNCPPARYLDEFAPDELVEPLVFVGEQTRKNI
jgi:hypothetical protein